MSYPSRIVVYLKPAVGATQAAVTIKKYLPADPATTELDITTTGAGLHPLAAGASIQFTLSALNNTRALVYGAPVGWPGGCRVFLSCILGETGSNETSLTGLKYIAAGPASPCDDLVCTFTGNGVLTCVDNLGVSISMDLNQPGKDALCLTLVPEDVGSSAQVTFKGGEFNAYTCDH